MQEQLWMGVYKYVWLSQWQVFVLCRADLCFCMIFLIPLKANERSREEDGIWTSCTKFNLSMCFSMTLWHYYGDYEVTPLSWSAHRGLHCKKKSSTWTSHVVVVLKAKSMIYTGFQPAITTKLTDRSFNWSTGLLMQGLTLDNIQISCLLLLKVCLHQYFL